MNQRIKDEIRDMKLSPLEKSNYLRPFRADYKINGKQKYWDFLTIHDRLNYPRLFNA